MPVFLVTEDPFGRTGGISEQGSPTYRRVFMVTSSTLNVGAEQVAAAPGIPKRGEIYISPDGIPDRTATLRNIQARVRPESGYEWTVECVWSGWREQNRDGNMPEQSTIQNPLLRPAEIRWGTVQQMRPLMYDVNDQPIHNSANDP